MNNNSLYITPALKVHIVDLAGVLCQSNVQSRNMVEGSWDEE